MTDKIVAPFTEQQVINLNKYQSSGRMHPFTCGGAECNRSEREDEGILIATTEGWVCPCGKYTQNWAHDFMVENQLPDRGILIVGGGLTGDAAQNALIAKMQELNPEIVVVDANQAKDMSILPAPEMSTIKEIPIVKPSGALDYKDAYLFQKGGMSSRAQRRKQERDSKKRKR